MVSVCCALLFFSLCTTILASFLPIDFCLQNIYFHCVGMLVMPIFKKHPLPAFRIFLNQTQTAFKLCFWILEFLLNRDCVPNVFLFGKNPLLMDRKEILLVERDILSISWIHLTWISRYRDNLNNSISSLNIARF